MLWYMVLLSMWFHAGLKGKLRTAFLPLLSEGKFISSNLRHHHPLRDDMFCLQFELEWNEDLPVPNFQSWKLSDEKEKAYAYVMNWKEMTDRSSHDDKLIPRFYLISLFTTTTFKKS